MTPKSPKSTRNHVNSTRIARRLGHAGTGGAAANTKNGQGLFVALGGGVEPPGGVNLGGF